MAKNQIGFEFQFNDYSKEVLSEFRDAVERALTKIGSNVRDIASNNASVDTGALAQSITYRVEMDENAVYIGVPHGPTSYGLYVELGTGQYYPGGRPTPWVYQDVHGNWHWTRGNPAKPFLVPAVKNNIIAIRETIKEEMDNG